LKSLTDYLWFEVPGRRGFINISPKIEGLVIQSGVREVGADRWLNSPL
jgi:hypothetical protein